MKIKLIKLLLPLMLLFACLGFVACDKEILPEQLSAPQNLRTEGDFLVWDEVEHADGYSVFIGNQEYLTKECRYGLSDLEETEIYPIEVMAYSDRGITHSESAYFQFTGRFALPTKGLQYELKSSDNTVRVRKFAVDSNGVCVIPATYQGYKVTDFTTAESMATMTSPTTFQAVCKKIKCLYLPYCFASRGGRAFSQFTNLEEIVLGKDLENGETRFVSEGNCIIDKENNALVLGCVNSVIPDYVTKIGHSAFRGRKNISSFTVPDQITEIGMHAFGGCSALQAIELPKNLSCEKFDFFNGCSSLTEITIPEGVVNLDEAFSGCSSLKEVQIPESVQSMDYAFQNCISLERCTVPKGVKSLIGTFDSCTSLKEVGLSEGIEEIGGTVTGLGKWSVFYKCTALTDISLPSTLKTIGFESFYGCTSLQSIEIPEGVTSIGLEAFYKCTSLQSVALPDSVTEIGGRAFMRCTSLQSVVIPENAATYYAFDGCTSLKSVVLSKNPQINNFLYHEGYFNYAFKNCPLEEVYFRDTKEEWENGTGYIQEGNTELLSATRYYYSETAPTEEGDYWRFVEGVPAKWE